MMRTKLIVVALIVLLAVDLLVAEEPVREEQFIYSVLAFNGRDYSGTFARREASTIYLIANVDNFITARNTFVYYWPTTGEWRTDTSVLNVPFAGMLELSGGRQEPVRIEMTPYTYYNVRGEYELNWKVAKEMEAIVVWRDYIQRMDAYRNALMEYRRQQAAYDVTLNELSTRITRQRNRGEDVSGLIDALRSLSTPSEPEYPGGYTVPPVPVQNAFVLNLSVGEYSIRLITEDELVMEGSERRIVVFDKRRADAIGIEVIPGDKWTRPIESRIPGSVLYVDGSTDLYLRPFYQEEYNDLFYEKMRQNDANGNPALMRWVRVQQVPHAVLKITRPGFGSENVIEQPFDVEQVTGAALGYQIVPVDRQVVDANHEPSLRAFPVPIDEGQRVIYLGVKDATGTSIASGERQIRIVRPSRLELVSLVFVSIPVIVMIIVMVLRSRKYVR